MLKHTAPALLGLSFLTSACLAESPAGPHVEPQAKTTDSPGLLTPPYEVTVYWENDSSFLKPNNASDRHYSNGIAATFTHQPVWAGPFADYAPLGESFDRTAAGYILGQMMFTPERITASKLIRSDRPYAGYLFAGLYLQRANESVFDHAQIDLGIVGPSSGTESLQESIHNNFNADDPKGWDNQLKDEPTIQLTLRRKWRSDPGTLTAFDHSLEQQWIPYVELGIGTVHRYVLLGTTYRVGMNLPDDFGPGRLADPASFTALIDLDKAQPTTCYGFVRVAGRAVEHNLFLEGNTYRSSHSVNAETLTGEVQTGIALEHTFKGWRIKGSYAQTFITEQFEGQDGPDSFGAVMLSASRGF